MITLIMNYPVSQKQRLCLVSKFLQQHMQQQLKKEDSPNHLIQPYEGELSKKRMVNITLSKVIPNLQLQEPKFGGNISKVCRISLKN